VATLWVDRGVVRRQDIGFGRVPKSLRDKMWEEEHMQRHKP